MTTLDDIADFVRNADNPARAIRDIKRVMYEAGVEAVADRKPTPPKGIVYELETPQPGVPGAAAEGKRALKQDRVAAISG